MTNPIKDGRVSSLAGIAVCEDHTLKPDEWMIAADPSPSMMTQLAVAQEQQLTRSMLGDVYRVLQTNNVDPDCDRGLRATIDYERSAHRKTTELLIEKDQALQALDIELQARTQQLALKASEAKAFAEECTRARSNELRALDDLDGVEDTRLALDLCIPIVRDLFEFTSDYKLHASCKAALAAYEELSHAATPAAALDPVPVGDAPARHLSDCQAERPAGVPSGQLPGPAARQEDRAVQALFDGILQCAGFTTAYIEWDRVGPLTYNHITDSVREPQGPVGRLTFDKGAFMGTREECLQYARDLALSFRTQQAAVFWRCIPKLTAETDFTTGVGRWSLYCRFGKMPAAEAKKMKGLTWKRTVAELQHFK